MKKQVTTPVFRSLLLLCCLLAALGARAETVPAGDLLLPDGTLNLCSLAGRSATLDPERGPVFTPAPPVLIPHTWNALDMGLNASVYAVAVSGTKVYVGSNFTAVGAGGTPVTGLRRIARWETPCSISAITLANAAAADCQNTTCTTDDTFTADVTVTYDSKPATGTLSLTGTDIVGTMTPADVASIGAASHTFTGVTMLADGGDVDLTATFSEGCAYNDSEVATAPLCGGGGYVPSDITASGFLCPTLNGIYVLDALPFNGAPAWTHASGGGFVFIYWSGSSWEIGDAESLISVNATGSQTFLPCTGGWTNLVGCVSSEGLVLTGGCGSLEGGGSSPVCGISDIALANESACNDNGTTDGSDDYFTADITVTFAYAPATGVLILDYVSGDKPGSANKSMVGLAEVSVAGLQCVTTYTFEDVQLVADGEFFGLTAFFSDVECNYGEGVWQAPAGCSCVSAAFTACPGNLSVNTAAGTCAAAVNYNAAADGEPAPTYAYEFTGATAGSGSGTGSGSPFVKGTTMVVVTATSNCGTSTCSFTVTVTDNEMPSVTCKNHTVSLNASGQANITPANVHQNSSDNCGTMNLQSVSPNSFNCNQKGANTVTLTVNDGNGNSKTCTATVTVQDNIAPNALCKNVTRNLGANGSALLLPQQVNNGSNDNCPGITLFSVSPSSFNCGMIGAHTVTLTVKDAVNNTSTCTATVTIQDIAKPLAKCKNVTINLDANGQATLTLAQVNNASTDNCGIASMSLGKTGFNCANLGVNTVALSVLDVNGNTGTCYSAVTVKDLIAPTVTCQNINVSLNVEGEANVSAAQVSSGSATTAAAV